LIADHGDPAQLDIALDRIFKIAKHFNAVLLLDEADVFMEQRSSHLGSHNRLVSVFLRKLEYYDGVLFLTTNRVMEFDEAILSRIHLKIKYHDLTKDARRGIWTCFLSQAHTSKGPSIVKDSDLERLGSMKLNGREVSLNAMIVLNI
jgi:SpoVK/Ycf46/Vps4 family AAA+-type ATPase